jgi:hypothetical protein
MADTIIEGGPSLPPIAGTSTAPADLFPVWSVSGATLYSLTRAQLLAALDAQRGYTPANPAAFLPLAGGTMAGDLKFIDATYDIGKSGATRPRDGFFSRNVTLGGLLLMGGATSGNAALKAAGNNLQARLGDDSGFAQFAASTVAVTGGVLQFSSATQFRNLSDGYLQLTNAAATDFTRLIFGTNDSSGLSIKKNAGPTFGFRNGNDTTDAPISAAAATFSGAVASPSGVNLSLAPGSGGAALLFGQNGSTDQARFWNNFGGSAVGFELGSAGFLGWSSTSAPTGTVDAGLTRNAAGVVEVNSGTAGSFRDLKLRALTSSGAIAKGTTTWTGARTLQSTDHDLIYTGTGGDTLTLVAASSNVGREVEVFNDGSGSLTVDATGLGQIRTGGAAAANTVTVAAGTGLRFKAGNGKWTAY